MEERPHSLSFKRNTCKLRTYRSKFELLKLKHITEFDRKPQTLFECCKKLIPHKCPKCEFRTYLEVDLKIHIDVIHSHLTVNGILGPEHECSECNFHTFSALVLTRHIYIKGHYSTSNEAIDEWFEFHCDRCSYKTNANGNLKEHILEKHTPPQIEWFHCEHCTFKTKYRPSLKRHLKDHGNNTGKWFHCEQCPHKSATKANLKEHILMKHSDPSKTEWFRCEHCPLKTKWKKDLRRHIRVVHAKICKWFQCEHCSYKTNEKRQLEEHTLRKHTERIRRFKCEFCSYETTDGNKHTLQRHILRKHTDPSKVEWWQCEQCSYKAKVKYDLNKHVEIMHLDKRDGAKRFKCDFCSYETSYGEAYLKKHVLGKHTDPSKIDWLQCEQCPFKTREKKNLKEHVVRRHSDEKLFKCQCCSFETNDRRALKKHTLEKHTSPSQFQ